MAITTNFDHLIERALDDYTQSMPLVIGHENLAHYITKDIARKIERPTILKIHRDLLLNPANFGKGVEKLHSKWVRALDNLLAEYHPVFIGYAGNDNSFMDYLISRSERFASGKLRYPYWMLYKDGNPEEKVSNFLDESRGYLIKNVTFDDVIYRLADKLGYIIPSKESFVEKAERRYQMLTDEIKGFADEARKAQDLKSTFNNPHIGKVSPSVDDKAEIEALRLKKASNAKAMAFLTGATLLFPLGKYKFEFSLKRVQRIIKEEPENITYLIFSGCLLNVLKRYDEAITVFQKTVDLEPENAVCLNNLGNTFYNLKRYDEALPNNQKAVDLEPENARYLNSLGNTFYELKRYDEALPNHQKSVGLEPRNKIYRDNLADTLIAIERQKH